MYLSTKMHRNPTFKTLKMVFIPNALIYLQLSRCVEDILLAHLCHVKVQGICNQMKQRVLGSALWPQIVPVLTITY